MLYQKVSVLLLGTTWVKVWMPDDNLTECRSIGFDHPVFIKRDHVLAIEYLGEFEEWEEE